MSCQKHPGFYLLNDTMVNPAFCQNSSKNQSRVLYFGVKCGFREPYKLLCEDLLIREKSYCFNSILKHLGDLEVLTDCFLTLEK